MEKAVIMGEAERKQIQLEAELGQSRKDGEVAQERFARDLAASQQEVKASKDRCSQLEQELEATKARHSTLDQDLAASRLEMEKQRATHDAKTESMQEELGRLRDAIQGKEGEAMEAVRRGQEALEQKREESIASEKEVRRELEAKREELAQAKASLAAAMAKADAMQQELDRCHAKEKAREEQQREEATKENQPRGSAPITSVLERGQSFSEKLEPSILDQGPPDEGLHGTPELEMLDSDLTAFERISTMSLRLRAALGDVSGCLKQIDSTLCRDWNERPDKALENIQKELRVAAGSRNLSLICLEELFGTGAASRTKGGLVGGLLASTAQTVKDAEEQVRESEQKARFLAEENDRLEQAEVACKVAKEDALRAQEEQWTELNRRLQSRKATSDLLAKKLQEELIQLTVELKHTVQEREKDRHVLQETKLRQQRQAHEEVSDHPSPPSKLSHDILAELATAGEAVSFGSYAGDDTVPTT